MRNLSFVIGLFVLSFGFFGCSGSGDSGGSLSELEPERQSQCSGVIVNGECVINNTPGFPDDPEPVPVGLLGMPSGHSGIGSDGKGHSGINGFFTGLKTTGVGPVYLSGVHLHWGVSLGLDGYLYGFSSGIDAANGAILKIDPLDDDFGYAIVTSDLKASLGLDDGPFGSLSFDFPGSGASLDSGQLLIDIDSAGMGALYVAADDVIAGLSENGSLIWKHVLPASFQVYGSPVFFDESKDRIVVVSRGGDEGTVLVLDVTDGTVVFSKSFDSRIEGNAVVSDLGDGTCVYLKNSGVFCPSFDNPLPVSGFSSNKGGLAIAGEGVSKDAFLLMAGNILPEASPAAMLRVDIANATTRVLQLTDSNKNPFISHTSVSRDGGTAYNFGSDGVLYAVSVNEFVLKWSLDLSLLMDGADFGGDILIDSAGRLYVSAGDTMFIVDDKGDSGILDSSNSLVLNQRIGKWRYPTLYAKGATRFLFQVDTAGRLNRFSARSSSL